MAHDPGRPPVTRDAMRGAAPPDPPAGAGLARARRAGPRTGSLPGGGPRLESLEPRVLLAANTPVDLAGAWLVQATLASALAGVGEHADLAAADAAEGPAPGPLAQAALDGATQRLVAGSLAPLQLAVTYTGVPADSVGAWRLSLAGPDGTYRSAMLLAVERAADPDTLVAYYQVEPPHRGWTSPDAGTHEVELELELDTSPDSHATVEMRRIALGSAEVAVITPARDWESAAAGDAIRGTPGEHDGSVGDRLAIEWAADPSVSSPDPGRSLPPPSKRVVSLVAPNRSARLAPLAAPHAPAEPGLLSDGLPVLARPIAPPSLVWRPDEEGRPGPRRHRAVLLADGGPGLPSTTAAGSDDARTARRVAAPAAIRVVGFGPVLGGLADAGPGRSRRDRPAPQGPTLPPSHAGDQGPAAVESAPRAGAAVDIVHALAPGAGLAPDLDMPATGGAGRSEAAAAMLGPARQPETSAFGPRWLRLGAAAILGVALWPTHWRTPTTPRHRPRAPRRLPDHPAARRQRRAC